MTFWEMNQNLLKQICYVLNIHNDRQQILLKYDTRLFLLILILLNFALLNRLSASVA